MFSRVNKRSSDKMHDKYTVYAEQQTSQSNIWSSNGITLTWHFYELSRDRIITREA